MSFLDEMTTPVFDVHPGGVLLPSRPRRSRKVCLKPSASVGAKTGRHYGELAAAIRAVAGRLAQFNRMDVRPDRRASLSRVLREMVARGELVCIKPGRPGRYNPGLAIYAKKGARTSP